MKLIIIDTSAENHGEYTRRINSFDRREVELFNLDVALATETTFTEEVGTKDVAILGAGLREQAVSVARRALTINPRLRIIMFVNDREYSAGAFRAAYAAGVHKVLPMSASSLDFLQELVAIFDSLRRTGAVREGKVVCVLQAKGGVGATSVCAALGDYCNSQGRKTLLWDFDIDSLDLCRSLSMAAAQNAPGAEWFEGPEVTRASMQNSVVSLTEHVSILPPPRDSMAEAFDFVGHTESLSVCGSAIDIAESLFDVVLIDSAGKVGPGLGALVTAADYILIVVDDSVMGLTGLDLFLNFLKPLIVDPARILFLVNGGSKSSLAIREIQANLPPSHELDERAWRLPAIPFDPRGASWPGSGKTLYGLSAKETRSAIESVALELGLGS